MFPRYGGQNTPWTKEQVELPNQATGTENKQGFIEFALLPLPDVREISLCKDKALRCEVWASGGVQLPVWSFSLSAQLSTLKTLVKLKRVQQSPEQWSAKVQFELAAVHAAVMKQEGKKKMASREG